MNFRERRFMDKEGKGYIFFLVFEMGCYAFSILLMTSFTSKVIVPSSQHKEWDSNAHPFPLLHQTLDWYHGFFKKRLRLPDAVRKFKKEIANPFCIKQRFCIYTVFTSVCSINDKFQFVSSC